MADKTPPFRPHAYTEHCRSLDYRSDGSALWRWNALGCWEPLLPGAAEAEAYQWIEETDYNHTTAENARRAVSAAVTGVTRLAEPSAADGIIPCRNGYLRVDTGELLPADKDLGMRYIVHCDYAPDAEPGPLFTQFLARSLPNAGLRDTLQEYAGYTLTGDCRHQVAALLIGQGANGKGVFANILQALHGRVAAMQLDGLDGFRLASIIGASLVSVDEVPRGRINEQIFKTLVAGEQVTADRKYREPLTLRPTAKWLILGNHLPVVQDHSTGFWRRLLVIPFGGTIPRAERDPLLARKIIETELPAVLAWALEGLRRLQARGFFATVGEVDAAVRKAQRETSSVSAHIDDMELVATGPADRSKTEVYDEYRAWCAANGMAAHSSVKFWGAVEQMFPALEVGRERTKAGQIRTCNLRPATSEAEPAQGKLAGFDDA